MRQRAFTMTALAAVIAIAGSLTAAHAQPPQPPQPPQQQPLSPPKPYKTVAIKLPAPITDPSFEAFRKQLSDVAARKDRAGLAKLVARTIFWMIGDKDNADKKKSGIDNLMTALGLDSADSPNWDTLAGAAKDPMASPHPQRKGVLCSPAEPTFDMKAADDLIDETQTDAGEWGFPLRDGIEVRSAGRANAEVAEKLGLHLVRVYPDDSPAAAVHADFVRIVTPSGKLGFVPVELLAPLGSDQLCYTKDATGWKIAGVIGGS